MLPEPKLEIPLHWNADYALALVGFLEGIIGAIWERHGPEMYTLIEQQAKDITTRPSDADEFFDELDAQIPF